MTLSPSHQGDEWGCLSPPAQERFYSKIGLCCRQTPFLNNNVLDYCTKHDYAYALCKTPCCEIDQLEMNKSVVLHMRYVILQLTKNDGIITIETLATYASVMICVKLLNATISDSPILFFSDIDVPSNTNIYGGEQPILISVKKTRPNHTAKFLDLLPLYQSMDIGMMLWFYKIAKQTYLAFFQSRRTGDIYCCTDGCKKKFDSVKEWREHFKNPPTLPGMPSMALLHDGIITAHTNAKLKTKCKSKPPNQDKSSSITELIQMHSWAWKSLMDSVNGPLLTQKLISKLHNVKRQRITY